MIHVTAEVVIDRPADEVFAYLSDFENNPRWQKGMKEATFTSEPPLQLGSTYDQVATFLGRRIVSSFEVIGFEPGRLVKITTTESSFPITVTRRVEPLEDGRCRVSADVEGDATGFFKFAAPLMKPMVSSSVTRDYKALKAILETGP